MMQWGRGKKHTDQTAFWYQFVMMSLVLFFSYTLISLVSYVFGVFRNGVDVLDPESRDLDRLATYIWPFDQDLALFADDAHQLLDAYVAEENIFENQRDRVDRVWHYIANHHDRLSDRGFGQYDDLFATFASLYPYRDEVYELLGSEQPFTYLIALQNTGEKRPNGGFFGSFVILTIHKGKIVTFQPVDSYFPDSIAPGVRISGPVWGEVFLDDNQVGFVAGNKYGFTDIDGRHLKILYERIFNEAYQRDIVMNGVYADIWPSLTNKYIKGVIFLRSDMREDMIPGFERKAREWQFVNATIDLIRGEDRTHKKELYMADMTTYFEQHRTRLLLSVLANIHSIREKHQVNMYLSNISDGLNQWLRDRHFTTTYDRHSLYMRDYNRSYSKVDRFVTKEIIVRNGAGQIVGEYVNQDIFSIRDRSSGVYMIDVYYHVNVPQVYRDFVDQMTDVYDVDLTDRERTILHLQPNVSGVLWATQGLIYLPKTRSVEQVVGDMFGVTNDDSSFARIVTYRAEIPYNNSTSQVSLTVTIP